MLIGADGLTPAVLKEADAALKSHGLIKVRVFSDSRDERMAMLQRLADSAGCRAGAAHRQAAGAVAPAGRPRKRWRRDAGMPGPRVVKILKFSKSGNHRPQVKKVKVFGNQRVTAGGEIKRAKPRVTSVKKRAAD